MFLEELSTPQLIVIYPGRFQPFHKGHYAVFNWLSTKFGRNNVYIATSNKTDNLKSPFTFAEKSYFMQLTGVPSDRIIQASSPYQIASVQQGGLTITDPSNTVVVFAVSEKDMAEDPRFSSWTKKDGSPSYFQPLTDMKQTKSMEEHGYIMTVPTFDFAVLGHPMRSASELRNLYATSDEKTRQQIIADLFGKYTREAEQIMNAKIPASTAEPVTEGVAANPLARLNKLHNKKQYQNALEAFMFTYGDAEGKQVLDNYSATIDNINQRGGTVYRGVWVVPGKQPNLKKPGKHWTISVESAIEFLDSEHGVVGHGDIKLAHNVEPVAYIVSATVGPNSITNKAVDIAYFTEELEVNLVNPASAKIKIVKQVPMPGYNEGVEESKQTRDPELQPLLVKARLAHPAANSDEEALALYTYDTEQQDINNVEAEEHSLEDRVYELEQKFAEFQASLNECGGVGVVRGGKDPRYMTATMGDQNDVTGSTLGKEMKAYGLVGRKSPGEVHRRARAGRSAGTGRGT